MSDALARSTDPDTSHEAADSLDPTDLELIVLNAIRKYPNGCIGEQIERDLSNIPYRTISPRFKPLTDKGYIIDTGERRKASSGRTQRVMLAIEHASKGRMTGR